MRIYIVLLLISFYAVSSLGILLAGNEMGERRLKRQAVDNHYGVYYSKVNQYGNFQGSKFYWNSETNIYTSINK